MKTNSLVILGLTLSLSVNTYAAKIIQSKNGKIMIDLEGESASPNQTISLLNAQNKKVAIGKITQVKNGKAVATILKGKSDGSEKVSLGGAGSSTGSASSNAENNSSQDNQNGSSTPTVFRTNAKKASVVVTVLSNAMVTKQADGTSPTPLVEDVDMKGNSFGITGIVDWPVMNSVDLRGTLGYEPFSATGTAVNNSCDGATSKICTAEISYISAGGFLRYDFTKSRSQIWAAAGATLKLPLGKTTTALNPDDIKMTMTYGASFGLDYFLTGTTFIPASFEYQMFLKSDTVSASIMILRAGYGMTF